MISYIDFYIEMISKNSIEKAVVDTLDAIQDSLEVLMKQSRLLSTRYNQMHRDLKIRELQVTKRNLEIKRQEYLKACSELKCIKECYDKLKKDREIDNLFLYSIADKEREVLIIKKELEKELENLY